MILVGYYAEKCILNINAEIKGKKKKRFGNLMNDTHIFMTLKNKSLRYYLFLAFVTITLFSTSKVYANLTQSIDRTTLSVGETVVLHLSIDSDLNAIPDLSALPKALNVISNSQYKQSSYINGKGSISRGWKIKIRALSSGKIEIPPIPLGHFISDPIILEVKKAQKQTSFNGKEQAIFIESQLDRKQAYIQQQIILTIKLFRAINTYEAELSEPKAGNSLVEKLGDDTQYDKIINGTRYIVTERRYAIFPQNSGSLIIHPVIFTAEVPDRNQNNQTFFSRATRSISIRTQEKKLEIKPAPSHIRLWIPATKVILADQWTPITKELKVGEPITWTLLLSVQGLTKTQLPAIEIPKIEGVQWYPDTPQKKHEFNKEGILGQRIEKIALIPLKTGKLTIPAITIKWWNVKTNTEEQTKIPSKTFNVIASKAITPSNQTSIPQKNASLKTPSHPSTGLPLNTIQPIQKKSYTFFEQNNVWQWISFLLLLGHFAIGGIIWIRRYRLNLSPLNKAPCSQDEKESYHQLIQHIKNNNAEQIEKYLIRWINHFSSEKIYSLGALLHHLKQEETIHNEIVDKLFILQQMRYAKNKNNSLCENKSINKHELLTLRKILSIKDKKSEPSIPSLYE
jgi:hypothetical protein